MQNLRSATVTPKLHEYPGPLVGTHRRRPLRGPGGRVSMRIQWKAGGCEGSLSKPSQPRQYPQGEHLAHAHFSTVQTSILQRFCREAVAWKHLRHPNILPLLGVTQAGRQFAMVSEWMDNGKISDFVQENPNANRTELVRAMIYLCDP